MAWLSDDKLQTFTTLGGQMVVLYHKNGQTNESSVNVSIASWANCQAIGSEVLMILCFGSQQSEALLILTSDLNKSEVQRVVVFIQTIYFT